MLTNLDATAEKFDALELRMRILLTLVGLAILYMLFDLFWFGSTDQQIKNVNTKIEKSKIQISELIDMQTSLNSSVTKTRNNPKHQRIVVLNEQIEQVRKSLLEKTVNLVPAEEMANVLKSIIESTKSLRLQSLTKQQTAELSEHQTPRKNDNQEAVIKLYRHSVEIVLIGNYIATYEFLRTLENMERKVAFDSFEYNVAEYPEAEVKLIVSTLSLEKEWIGG